jgi:hypothetical protein
MALDDNIVIWDIPALDLYFRSPFSAVGGRLAEIGVAIESSAKLHASGRPGPNVVSGRLRSSIHFVLGEDFLSLFVDIGPSVYYGGYVERGHPNTAHGYTKADGSYGYVSDRPTRAYPFMKPAYDDAVASGLIPGLNVL